MRDSKTSARSGVCGRLSWEVAGFLGCQDWLAAGPAKDRPCIRRRQLRIEPLEARHLMDAAGLASLVSPIWFESVSDLTGPAHAGTATWTTQDMIVPTQAESVAETSQSNLYDWIVQFDTASLAGITSVAQTASLLVGGGIDFTTICGLGLTGQVLVRSSGASLETVENWLGGNTLVTGFEQDALREVQAVSNDPLSNRLWGMTKINAQAAWQLSTGSPSVVVAVIDTGVDYTHSDLAANIWTNSAEIAGNGRDDDGDGFIDDVYGYDFANNDGDPMDDNSHGTHVAGTIAAVGNNNLGVVGVNWSVSVMPVKFLDSQGAGYVSDAIRAINYVTMQRVSGDVNVRVINASWGGSGFSSAMQSAIQATSDAGILFVAAAGNSGTNNDASPQYPANYAPSNVISVAASDQNDRLASFSCYGATTVDVAAPGVSIYSTVPNNRYATYSGTSMATPMVSGVAALAWAVNPNATVAQVRDAILCGADSVSALNGKVATGGRLDAYDTLRLMGAQVQQGPTISSLTVSPGSVTVGSIVTLTAHGVTASPGTPSSVAFFQDVNGNGQYDAGDVAVGATTTIVGGEASVRLNTANLAAGTHCFLARAQDNAGQWSSAAVATLTLLPSVDHGNNAATSTAIGVSSSTQGTIGAKGDVDWFKFQAVAGTTYVITTQLGTLPDSVLNLYNSDGTTVLARNDDNGSSLASRITWRATASETYYVVVGAYGNVYTGGYTLSVQARSASSSRPGRSIPTPAPLAGSALAWMAFQSHIGLGGASRDAINAITPVSPLADSAALPHDDVFAHLAEAEGYCVGPMGPHPALQPTIPLGANAALSGTRERSLSGDLAECCSVERHVVDGIFDRLGGSPLALGAG